MAVIMVSFHKIVSFDPVFLGNPFKTFCATNIFSRIRMNIVSLMAKSPLISLNSSKDEGILRCELKGMVLFRKTDWGWCDVKNWAKKPLATVPSLDKPSPSIRTNVFETAVKFCEE